MASHTLLQVFVYFLVRACGIEGLFIDGCPMYGCRPSGSFSFYLQVPKSNASVKWVSDFPMDPVPNPSGCVADSSSIICQSNGVFAGNQGYVSVRQNGSVSWRDKVLHFPTLPLLDNYGDVIGSDGDKLVRYDQDGNLSPVFSCQNLKPFFNMALVGDSDLLLVSGSGNIVVRQTNGVPVGSITLNVTIASYNGSFIPVAQPAVNTNANRFYLLTTFVPQVSVKERSSVSVDDVSEIRVYAIDVHQSISNRITVAWYYTISDNMHGATYKQSSGFSSNSQALVYDRVNQLLYVNVKSRKDEKSSDAVNGMLLGLDNNGKLVFKKEGTDTLAMTKFVTDHCSASLKSTSKLVNHASCDSLLWLLTYNNVIQGVDTLGKTKRSYNLNTLLDASVNVTSLLSSVRNSDEDNDTLIFAAILTKQDSLADVRLNMGSKEGSSALYYRAHREVQTTYVIAINTTMEENDKDAIMWMVPAPNNMRVLGQISGAGGADLGEEDHLIAYAEQPGKSAVIFSIH